jgi:hypothetical protein
MDVTDTVYARTAAQSPLQHFSFALHIASRWHCLPEETVVIGQVPKKINIFLLLVNRLLLSLS